MTASSSPIWAAFDFDGTLTNRDTFILFLRKAAGTRWRPALLRASPFLLLYAMSLIFEEAIKRRLLRRCIGGVPEHELRAFGDRFAAEIIPKLLRPETYAFFQDHKRQGHTCVLVSASLDLYLKQWTQQAGFDHLICSKLQVAADGTVTGNFNGGNCSGPEKARRLREILPIDAKLYAYGNSRGDKEMLAMAHYRYYRDRWLRKPAS